MGARGATILGCAGLTLGAEEAQFYRDADPFGFILFARNIETRLADSFEQALKLEYRMVSQIKFGHDFFEGVRAQLVDKDRSPKWSPARLEDVDIAPYLEAPSWGDLDFH